MNHNLEREKERIQSELNGTNSSAITRAFDYADRIVLTNRSLTYGSISLPDSVKRAVAMGNVNAVQGELEFLQAALTLVRRTQLQDIADYCESYRQNAKEGRDAATLQQKMKRATATREEIDQTFEAAIASILEKLQAAAKIGNAKIRQIRTQQLEQDLEKFSKLQQQLIEQLLVIVSPSRSF